ncbi:MAG: hypothetical protein ACE365_00430 [Gammaproteobacteria bacterium]
MSDIYDWIERYDDHYNLVFNNCQDFAESFRDTFDPSFSMGASLFGMETKASETAEKIMKLQRPLSTATDAVDKVSTLFRSHRGVSALSKRFNNMRFK